MKDLTTMFLDGQTPYYKYVCYLCSFVLIYKLNAINANSLIFGAWQNDSEVGFKE